MTTPAIPSLRLSLTGADSQGPSEKPLHFRLPKNVVPFPSVEAGMREYVETNDLYPLRGSLFSGLHGRHLLSTDYPEAERYNIELNDHLEEYRWWLTNKEALENVGLRTVRLSVWLTNEGEAAAQDASILLAFSGEIEWVFFSKAKLPDELKMSPPPEPPSEPSDIFFERDQEMSFLEMSQDKSYMNPAIGSEQDMALLEPSPSGEGLQLTLNREQITPGANERLIDLYLLLSYEHARSFDIRYHVESSNLTTSIESGVHVEIELVDLPHG